MTNLCRNETNFHSCAFNTSCINWWHVTEQCGVFLSSMEPTYYLCSPAPSLSYSLSRWQTCTAISCYAIHTLLVSAGMLLTGNVPLILQVQRKTWPRFREPCWGGAPPNTQPPVFNGPHRGKRLTVCLHRGISELVLIIEPLSIQRHRSQPRCLFHRSLNLCRSPNVHYSSKLARGL